MDELLKTYMQPAIEVIAKKVERDLLDFYTGFAHGEGRIECPFLSVNPRLVPLH